jgi:WD40 repeat protein
MPTRSALVLGVIYLVLVSAPLSHCEPPAARDARSAKADQPVRTDRYGDPLPPGVVARLGTERLAIGNGIFLTYSPDGRRLAAHNGSAQLRVWEVDSGKELLRVTTPTFMGYGTGMRPLVFSPDSKLIALACPAERVRNRQPASVRVWEAATGKERHCFSGLQGQMAHLVFSPDGRHLFAGGYGVPLLRWDLVDGGTPKEYRDLRLVTCLALSREGKTLAAATGDQKDWRKRIFICWDAATGKEIARHALTIAGNWACSLSPDGGLFAAPDADGKNIALLDPLTGRELSRARESEYPALVSFSADCTAMTCSSKDGTVCVWDTATGKLRTRFKASSTHVDWVALSPDGKWLALSGMADYAIHVWDVAAGRELHSFVGHRGGPLSFAFLKDGKEIATVGRDGPHGTPIVTWKDWSLRLWDVATGAERAVTRADPKGSVSYTAFSADGRLLATVIHDGTLRLWDVDSGEVVRSWKVPTRESTTIWKDDKGGQIVFKTPDPLIQQPVFSPDGKTLLATQDAKIRRWEVATGKELPAFEMEDIAKLETPWCLPSPDGRTLVVWRIGGRYPPVLLLDAASGKLKRRLPANRGGYSPPAFSPDGRTLAVIEVGEVSLWEVASGQSRGRLKGPMWAHALAFSPNGRFLAVGTYPEAPVVLWDLSASRIVGQLRNDVGHVDTLAFSPDGSRLALAGYFPTVLLCDVAELCGKRKLEEIAKTTEPFAGELEGLWAELSGGDGARAYRAIRQLGLAGKRGAVFLKARLKSDQPPDERRIPRLIADLDADQFATREKASAELEKLGMRAEPALRRTLDGTVSAEVRSRVKRLLERLGTPQQPRPEPELVRLRIVEALEANGSREARQVLAELAKEATDTELMREAKASLARLSRRPAPAP